MILARQDARKDGFRVKFSGAIVKLMAQTEMGSPEEIGARLRAVRQALGLGTQAELAARLGVSRNRYNNWETGLVRIPPEVAVRLWAMTGVTLNYLFIGDASGLPFKVFTLLTETERKAG